MTTDNAATIAVLEEVAAERRRQDELWGEQNHSPAEWITILGEEYGEASRGAYEIWHDDAIGVNYREELIHTAAVCIAAAESYDRNEGKEE